MRIASQSFKKAIRQAGVRGFGPSGTFEQDDMDNWQECTRTGRGVISRRMPLNMQMGLGHDRFDPALAAWASEYRYSENNHRHFYRHWSELVTGTTWAELAHRSAREDHHA